MRALFYFVASIILLLAMASGHAHEDHPGDGAEAKRVNNFLQTWRRPRGNFSEINHRVPLCCYSEGPSQDCFEVGETKIEDGKQLVHPRVKEDSSYNRWYELNASVIEDLQEDPYESPNGLSYVCILGNQIACHVRGSGQ